MELWGGTDAQKVTRLRTETGQYLAGTGDLGSEGNYHVEDQAH